MDQTYLWMSKWESVIQNMKCDWIFTGIIVTKYKYFITILFLNLYLRILSCCDFYFHVTTFLSHIMSSYSYIFCTIILTHPIKKTYYRAARFWVKYDSYDYVIQNLECGFPSRFFSSIFKLLLLLFFIVLMKTEQTICNLDYVNRISNMSKSGASI